MTKFITITVRFNGSRELQYITDRNGVMPLCNMLDKNQDTIEYIVCDGLYVFAPGDFATDFCTHFKWVEKFNYTRS